MDRIRFRIVLLVALSALSSIFVASPAQASASCHPMPDAVCETPQWVYDCVYTPIRYGYMPEHCDRT